MSGLEWLEIKRYKTDPENQFFELDLPGIEVHLVLQSGQYCLCCPTLGFENHVIDNCLATSQTVAVKLVIYELSKRIHFHQALLNRLTQK